MAGYVKLFSDIVDSSIWEEDPFTCKVWVTMLALADPDGFVRGSVGWLAGKSRVTVEQCQSAVDKFQLPDMRSRTDDNAGRRIEQLEDGWLILNYITFRERLSPDAKASATRERVRKHRERYSALRNKKSVTGAVPASASASVLSVPGNGGMGEDGPNHPDLATCVTHFQQNGGYDSEQVKRAFLFFDGTKTQDGTWYFGQRPVTDWRAVMELKMRDKTRTEKPKRNQFAGLPPTSEQIEERRKVEEAELKASLPLSNDTTAQRLRAARRAREASGEL